MILRQHDQQAVFFQEDRTAPKLLGFLAVLTGMFFVNAQALADGKTPWGLFCGIMSAVMYAVMVIFNKKAASIAGIENAMWQLVISFATVAVFVGVKQGFAMEIAPADVAPILLLGIVNTGIGCYLYFSSIGSLPVQTVAICGYLEPLGALVFSALLLGQRQRPGDWRLRRRRRRVWHERPRLGAADQRYAE
jgi:drug/metabolite transporter (DMT)-like permease